jgi:transcriptional regulator with XRE-family HTH domain
MTIERLNPDPDGRINTHVGGRIRQRRRALGVSQAALAEAIGVSFQQVQKYEIGVNRISAPTLWRISQALKAPADYWFEGLPTSEADMDRYDQTARVLLTDDGQQLARAFSRITSRSARLALIAVARELMGDRALRPVDPGGSPPESEAPPRVASG